MSEQAPTKKVTLEELRRAIERIPPAPNWPVVDTVSDLRFERAMSGYERFRAEAWRAAFEWLHHGEGVARCGDSYVVGLMLIEGKLR